MRNFKAILGLAAIGFAANGYSADVTGKVAFTGAAPKKEVIKMNADPVCAKETAGKTILKEEVLVNSNKTLANVFVYVKEGVKPESVTAAPTEPFVFDQKGCQYHPHVFGIRVGQPLKILNSDPTLHNVNAQAKANAKFNQGMPTKGQVIEKKFTKAEMGLKIKCDVHGWMNAYGNVMEHPFFAVTDDKGEFHIKGLPAGEYTLEAWHEKLGAKTAKVTVADAGGKTDFSF